MHTQFKNVPDSTLIGGQAHFGKRGKRMIITGVRERTVDRDCQTASFILFMRPDDKDHSRPGRERAFFFSLDEVEIELWARVKVIYRFPQVKSWKNMLTIYLQEPDELVLAW